MDIDYYNTRIRQAISDEYVKCSKKIEEYEREYAVISVRLASEKDTLTYTEYRRLEDRHNFLSRMQEVQAFKLDVWDQAREICLNIADEMEDSK